MFDRDAGNPIEAKLIVVDETSMLDVELGAALIAAIADGTHLVIVGDPAQLPSIGPGRVLGDLIDSGTAAGDRTHQAVPAGRGRRHRPAGDRGPRRRPAASTDPTHEVVIVPARGSDEAAHRVVQVVTDSIPRVFDCERDQIQVVTPAKMLDIEMLVMTVGGKERTQAEFAELFASSGLGSTASCRPRVPSR